MSFNRPLPIANPKNVLVLVLDFDGCLRNQTYIQKQKEIDANCEAQLGQLFGLDLQSFGSEKIDEAMQKALIAILRLAKASIFCRMQFQARLFTSQLNGIFDRALESFLEDEKNHKREFFSDANQALQLKKYLSSLAQVIIPKIEEMMPGYRKALHKALLEANPKVVAHAKETVQANSIDLVVGMIGSARQSYAIDSNNHSSCFVATEGFIELLESAVNVPCVMNRSLLSDGYGNLPVGSNFNYIANGDFQFCTNWFFDTYKNSIYYTQAHEIRGLFKEAKIWFDGIDDKLEYLQAQMYFFGDGYKLPAGMVLRTYEYDGATFKLAEPWRYSKKTCPAIIEGKGIHDNHYNANVRMMVELSYRHWNDPNFAGDKHAISLYGDNEIKYESERHFSIDNLLREIKLQFERWKGSAGKYYSGESINAFHKAFDALYTSLQFDVMAQKEQRYSEEAIHLSAAGVTARECLRLLRLFMYKRFYSKKEAHGLVNTERQQQLLQYQTACGQQTPFIYVLTLMFLQKTSLLTLYQLCVRTPVLSHAESVLRYLLTSWPVLKPAQWVGRHSNQLLFSTTSLAPQVAAVGACVKGFIKEDDQAWQENRAKFKKP